MSSFYADLWFPSFNLSVFYYFYFIIFYICILLFYLFCFDSEEHFVNFVFKGAIYKKYYYYLLFFTFYSSFPFVLYP